MGDFTENILWDPNHVLGNFYKSVTKTLGTVYWTEIFSLFLSNAYVYLVDSFAMDTVLNGFKCWEYIYTSD